MDNGWLSERKILKGKFLKSMICLHGDSMYLLVYSTDDWLNRRGMEMFFSFDYVIKGTVNVAAVQP